jgi:DNA primase
MSVDSSGDLRHRIQSVRERAGIVAVIGRAVALGKGRKPRGKCPFHGSKSDSFAVDPDRERARCWGCGWSGDVIDFVRDFSGLDFMGALKQLEDDHNLAQLTPAPVRREKREQPPSSVVDSATMGRLIWKRSRPLGAVNSQPGTGLDPVRTYLRARGVAEAWLAGDRLSDIKFCPAAPIAAWPANRRPDSVPCAPAMVALVRRPVFGEDLVPAEWEPIGVHVTYLAADFASKMERRRRDGSPLPARKMLGATGGGAVLLGRHHLKAGSPLFVGEGIETVLSGLALCDAAQATCGLAVLSLDNLQGAPLLWRKGVWPLFGIEGDPGRPPLAFAHDGPVTGLIDADMKMLRGPRAEGFPIVEEAGGPIVQRAISSAERADICARLFVQAWRRAGCQRVRALRPHMGRDFNDEAREAAA